MKGLTKEDVKKIKEKRRTLKNRCTNPYLGPADNVRTNGRVA